MIQVVAAVIRDAEDNILITRRAQHVHQGGLWEFPGGKREAGETARQALQRELHEELGIEVLDAVPLIKVNHDYGDKQVQLEVWTVRDFAGEAWGREGQAWQWIRESQLDDLAFPAANTPIIKAARLPPHYAVLEGSSAEQIFSRYQQYLACGVRLMQLRLKDLPCQNRPAIIEQIQQQGLQQQVTVLLNSDLAEQTQIPAVQGLHLTSQALMALTERPQLSGLIAASCHNLQQLQQAERLGLDFAVLAPVQVTTTHPDAQPLGWDVLSSWLDQINLPVYLMGGLRLDDLQRARLVGAQGLAGITTFLDPA